MTWEWVVLILGVMVVVASLFAYMEALEYGRRESGKDEEIKRLRQEASLREKRM